MRARRVAARVHARRGPARARARTFHEIELLSPIARLIGLRDLGTLRAGAMLNGAGEIKVPSGTSHFGITRRGRHAFAVEREEGGDGGRGWFSLRG